MKSKHIRSVTLSLLASFTALMTASAQYDTWTNSGTGDWFTPGNWSLGALPASSTDASIGQGTALISSGTAQARRIYLGNGGTGAMQVSNGAALETGIGETGGYYTVLGYGNGSATVTGTGSTWTFGVPIYVGTLGGGSLSIENGGKVQQSVTSNWGSSLIIGGYSGNGSVSISGSGSNLTTRDSAGIHIGNDQQGSLAISNGGSASVGYAFVGGNASSNGSVTVTGANSQLLVKNSMSIANTGNVTGALTVSAGGNVTANSEIYLARDGQGSVTLTGDGSKLVSGASTTDGRRGNIFLADGQTGDATLTVADGALLQAAPSNSFRTLYLAKDHATSQATLQIGTGGRAGTVDVASVVGGAGVAKVIFNHSDEDYVFNSGITGTTSVIHSGTGTTRLVGAKTYSGSTTINAGALSIFASGQIGSGDVTIGGGTLKISSGSADFGTRLFSLTSADSTIETVASDYNGGNSLASIGGVISGNGRLNKAGGGELTLTGNNTYSGGTVIEGGTLRIGYFTATGMVSGDIENNGHLEFHRADSITFGGAISGTGNLTKWGYGGLTLTDTNTYTGATFIKAGTLTISGAISGAGGLVTIDAGATLNGLGMVDRDILVNGTLASTVIVTGQVTLSNQQLVGTVLDGTQTAASGQQLVVTSATGGNVNAAAGTASIETLNGATLQTGNWGASVVNLTSGNVETSGGSLVAQQGDFNGSISGSGGLTKTGSGILTLKTANSYTGTTIVRDGILKVAVSGATGSAAPVRLENDGVLRVNSSVAISGNVVTTSADAKYVKEFGAGEALSNSGSFQSNLSGSETTVTIAQGTATVGNPEVTMQFSNNGGFGSNASDRLSITGLNGTAFLLVMDVNMDIPVNPDLSYFFLGWFDPADGALKNAVEGNVGAGTLAAGYKMSYGSFLSNNSGWNPVTMLGAYGADSETNQVWAVINHNSEFAVAPEPSSCGLMLFGLGALLIRRKRG